MARNFKYNFTGILITLLILEVLFWVVFALVYFVVMDALPGLRFQKPHLAWLFLTGPLMFLLFILAIGIKNRRLGKFSDTHLLGDLVPDISSVNAVSKFTLWRLALAFLITALINPQLGSKMAEAKVRGIDIIVAVDVSNSMMAEDLSPNRLVRAKRALERMLENLHGDRVGIIVFAGQAFVQLPITNDYAAGKLFLSTIDTDIVPVQGTAIGSAIDLARKSFDEESPAQKAIVIITDGENHEDDAVESAKAAAEKGMKVYTIGMGSPQGTPIPEYRGQTRTGYKKGPDGKIVVSSLNEDMLREIANAGNGTYVRASNAEIGLEPLLAELNQMEKTEMGTVRYAEYEDRFQIFLALALAFLLIEFLISERKSKLARRIKLFEQ
jgi:Ca-activated chloride channel family protein